MMILLISSLTRWRRLWRVGALVAASGCAAIAPANIGAAPFCAPALAGDDAAGVSWELGGQHVDAASDAPTLRDVGRVFEGTWDMLTVASEGVSPPAVARWRLRLTATDASARDLCRGSRCSSDVGYPAAGAPVNGFTHFDSTLAARGQLRGSDAVRVFYNRYANRLQLTVGDSQPDHGTLYYVTRVTDSSFTGRWTDASVVLSEVRRGEVRTEEHLQGYFCGRRSHG